MGYLFENMDKMDIQAERENTRVAREEAEKQRQEAEKQKKHLNQGIKLTVQRKRAENNTKEQAIEELNILFGLDSKEAKEKVELYWE